MLCVGHLGHLIEAAVGDGAAFGLEVAYSHDGPTVIGTGAAVRKALPLLGAEFLVLYGDTYLRIDYAELVREFRRVGLPAMMAVLRNGGQWGASNADFDGRLVRYDKFSADGMFRWIDYGVSVMGPEVFELVPPAETDLAGVLSRLSHQELLAGFAARKRFYEIGSPAALQETAEFLAQIRGQTTLPS